jgi:hypothetical protein
MALILTVQQHTAQTSTVSGIKKHSSVQDSIVLEVLCNGTLHQVAVPEAVLPVNAAQWKVELRWYLEDYIIRDPFSRDRAKVVTRKLSVYGKELAGALCKSLGSSTTLEAQDLLIEISSLPEQDELISSLYWETLETSDSWPMGKKPKNVTIVRHVGNLAETTEAGFPEREISSDDANFPENGASDQENIPSESPIVTDQGEELYTRPQHILVLTARPLMSSDIPHRLISRIIFDVIRRWQSDVEPLHELEICSPGTLEALQLALESRPMGYFDIVHLDVHGEIIGEKSVLTLLSTPFPRAYSFDSAFLQFLAVDQDNGQYSTHRVSADEIGTLLHERGVRQVVTNACQSASGNTLAINVAQYLVQAGLDTVVGMSHKITDSAARIFVHNLYHQYLTHKHSLQYAARQAREALRVFPLRRTKYATEIELHDHLVPRVYTSRQASTYFASPNFAHGYKVLIPDTSLIGREIDILEIETRIAAGCNVVAIKGPPGIGKTELVLELENWWKMTGFGSCHYHQANHELSLTDLEALVQQPAIVRSAASGWNEQPHIKLDASAKREIFMFDSMDEIWLRHTPNHEEHKIQFRRLLLKLARKDNVCILLVCRKELSWLKSVANFVHTLAGLGKTSRLELASRVLRRMGRCVDFRDAEDCQFLEYCLGLTAGNPLAIELLIQSFCQRHCSLKEFYRSLLSSDQVVLNTDWMLQNEGARITHWIKKFLEALRSVCGKEQMIQIFYLSYFWQVLPYDLVPLWFFLVSAMDCYHLLLEAPVCSRWIKVLNLPAWTYQFAYELMLAVENPTENRLLNSKDMRLYNRQGYERMNEALGREVPDRRYPGFSIDASGESLYAVPALEARLRHHFGILEEAGLVSDLGHFEFPSPSGTRKKRYYSIHPVLTLVLKDQISCLPHQLIRTADNAYMRFCMLRYSEMHWHDLEDAETHYGVVRQIELELMNFISGANLALKRDLRLRNNVGNLKAFIWPHWSEMINKDNLAIYCDFLERLLDRAEQQMKTSKSLSLFKQLCLTFTSRYLWPGSMNVLATLLVRQQTDAEEILQRFFNAFVVEAKKFNSVLILPKDHLFRRIETRRPQAGGSQNENGRSVEQAHTFSNLTLEMLDGYLGRHGNSDARAPMARLGKVLLMVGTANGHKQVREAQKAAESALESFPETTFFSRGRVLLFSCLCRLAITRGEIDAAAEHMSSLRQELRKQWRTVADIEFVQNVAQNLPVYEAKIHCYKLMSHVRQCNVQHFDDGENIALRYLDAGVLDPIFIYQVLYTIARLQNRFERATHYLELLEASLTSPTAQPFIEAPHALIATQRRVLHLLQETAEKLSHTATAIDSKERRAIQELQTLLPPRIAFLNEPLEADAAAETWARGSKGLVLFQMTFLALLDMDFQSASRYFADSRRHFVQAGIPVEAEDEYNSFQAAIDNLPQQATAYDIDRDLVQDRILHLTLYYLCERSTGTKTPIKLQDVFKERHQLSQEFLSKRLEADIREDEAPKSPTDISENEDKNPLGLSPLLTDIPQLPDDQVDDLPNTPHTICQYLFVGYFIFFFGFMVSNLVGSCLLLLRPR